MAVKLFLNKACYPSVVTLAGAAEEVFGRMAARTGVKPVLEEFYEPAAVVHKALHREELDKKAFSAGKNRARNALKHLQQDGGDSISIDLEDAACWMLVRALGNAQKVGVHVPRQAEFDDWFYENIVGIQE